MVNLNTILGIWALIVINLGGIIATKGAIDQDKRILVFGLTLLGVGGFGGLMYVDQRQNKYLYEEDNSLELSFDAYINLPSVPETCIGCKHLHGEFYPNGEMLICGYFPYGPDGNECSDYEILVE